MPLIFALLAGLGLLALSRRARASTSEQGATRFPAREDPAPATIATSTIRNPDAYQEIMMPTFPPEPRAEDWIGWGWPVPVTDGRVPLITQEFKPGKRTPTSSAHADHLGIDIMFPKRAGDPPTPVKHDASKAFIAPWGTPVVAAFGGKVWAAGTGNYGNYVLIDHGAQPRLGGVNTFYQHLESFARPWKKGDEVHAGELLGLMGFSPAIDGEQLRHLHFELRFPRAGIDQDQWPVDPAPYMRFWRKIALPEAVA